MRLERYILQEGIKGVTMHQIIVVGVADHNALGQARCFGIHGIKPVGIFVSSEINFAARSKYWSKIFFVKSEDEVMHILQEEYAHHGEKPTIIATSDGMAKKLDQNYSNLSASFILGSFGANQGKLSRLMDKNNQVKLMKRYGFTTIETTVLNLSQNGTRLNKESRDLKFPVILKPVDSTEGKKKDIRICESSDVFIQTIKELQGKKYHQVLCQRYLKDKTEYVVEGAINMKADYVSYTILKNLRQWPEKCGTGSFSAYCVDGDVTEVVEHIVELLKAEEYDGIFDIEIFKSTDGEFVINEFNWRSGGRNFVSLDTNVYSSYEWCQSHWGELECVKNVNTKQGYTMNEATDLRHVFKGNVPLRQWIKDLCITKSYALWDWKDPRPALSRYRDLFIKLCKGQTVGD